MHRIKFPKKNSSNKKLERIKDKPIMRYLDFFVLVFLAALWGGSFLFLRLASPILGPIWLIEIRVFLASIVLSLFLSRLGLISELKRNFKALFFVGCLNSAIPFLLIAFATLSLPAGFTSILNATAPLFGTVVAFVWLQEKITVSRAIGFALAFAGVTILVGWKSVSATPSFLIAVAAGLLAAMMYAIAGVYAQKYLSGIPPLALATGSQLGAAIFILPAMPFAVPTSVPTPTVILIVLFLAVFSTALAYILYFQLLERIGPTKTLTVTYLIPLFAMIWGAIALHEPITKPMIWGCSLILLGTAIANDLLAGIFHTYKQ
jgi:drug/metabolite transporter (DMT)-like permease